MKSSKALTLIVCGVFQFAVLAHGGGLAVALDRATIDAQRRHGLFRQIAAQFLADVDQLREILLVLAGEGIGDDGHGGGAADGGFDRLVLFGQRLVDNDHHLADLRLHLKPSSPLISLAARPPALAWTRGPVVITSATTISWLRGASVTPTSMASKWLRT